MDRAFEGRGRKRGPKENLDQVSRVALFVSDLEVDGERPSMPAAITLCGTIATDCSHLAGGASPCLSPGKAH